MAVNELARENAATAAPRQRCRRCLRVQRGGCTCGLCGGTLFDPLPPLELVAPCAPSSSGELEAPPRLAPNPPAKSDGSEVDRPREAPARRIEARNPTPAAPEAPRARPRRVSLGSVEREVIERVQVGWGGIDHVFGGGMPRRRVILLGGLRGTGKSSLMLPVCARVAAVTNRPALYCSAEGQTAGELAASVPRELDAAPIETCCSERLDDMMADALELEPAIVVFDSIQSIRVDGVRLGDDVHARYLLTLFDQLARASNAVIVAISQMSGQGRLRGSELYQQLCDTIAELERIDDEGELSEDGERIRLRIKGKNRGGPVDRRAFFRFDDDGALRPELEVKP